MPKLPIWPWRTHFLIFQLFVVLLVLQTPAWAVLSSLTVDANGDSIFNGTNEKLTISFTTSDQIDEGKLYTYEIKLADGRKITDSPADGLKLKKDQTIQYIWDGTFAGTELPDGIYTIQVVLKLKDSEIPTTDDPPNGDGTVTTPVTEATLEIEATFDTTEPTIDDVSVGFSEFSPIFDATPVYYTLSEEVAEAWLEILSAAEGKSISRRIELDKTKGSHTFYWDGTDGNRRFEDGNYRLRLVATDKAGNTAEPKTTEQITIDSEEPQITDILINDSIPIVEGAFVNASIETISFTVDAGGSSPLSSKIQIKPVGGTNLSGTLVTVNNKATLTLENSIDDVSENGTYEVTASVSDRVGNLETKRARFTFDNTAPTLKSISTNRETFKHGSGLNGQTNYVEAELEDNFELDLSTSSIRLIGPDGNLVLGQQTLSTNNRIRWQFRSPLLARDGIHDGHYNVQIVGADKANNRTETINIAFVFDNLAPELVSLQPTRNADTFDFLGDTAYYNLPLNQFVATFNDGDTGTGVLFSGEQNVTSIIFGTPRSDGNIDEISGRVFPDKANNVLTYILNSPLIKTDGSQDGNYVISVKAVDTIGNVNITQYQIIYDTQVPTLKSTLPAANQTVSTLSEVVVKLDETTSGIDFAQSNFRLTRNEGGNQVDVPVNISSNGTDTITLTLLQEIAIDGSDDGTYTIEITPSDRAGNMGAAVRRQFYLVSKTQPRVRLATPETGTVNNLSDISAVIDNYIGAGINFDDSTITVSNADGIVVPDSKVEHDAANNQLTWSTETSIPRNGTADGEYSILVVYVDFSGKEFMQSFPLNLDTQYPAINAVEVGTDPQRQLSTDSKLDVPETFSQINITFAESDVDFENTSASLTGPDGTNIALHQSNDGENRLTLNFQNLSSLGTYTLSVTPTDKIGNVSQVSFIYRFDLDIAVPVVTSVLIGGQSGSVAYVNENAGEIVANLVDTTGIGLAIGEGESDIVVTSSIGLPVPGITTANNQNQLIWRPTALPTDGSGDGRYIVTVTPVDNAGRTGDVAYRSFIYDTQKPRLTSATPITLHQPISYIGGSLANFQFGIEDVGPASFDLDAQTISLQKVDGDVVIGQTTHDGVNQVFFTLSAPLPADGSADGEYLLTVNLVDKSGNQDQIQHTVFYDSQVPVLSTVSLNTQTPLDLTPYLVTELDETVNRITLNFVDATRVDFVNTTITLTGPDGSDIPLNLDNNGVDQLTASFASLNQDGLYTLSVTAQDITGNADRGAIRYPFRIKFEIPELLSVKANITDTAIDLIPNEIVDIVDVINQVTLQFTDPSRLDHENTQVELLDPNGQQLHLTQEEDVSSQLIVRFISVTENGVYTLIVTPHDMDGNIAQLAERYQFRLDIAFPSVSSVLIDGQLSSAIYVNDAVATIVATFIEPAGVGLDFSDDGSSIVVTNQNGVEVIGTTESNEQNQLTWTPLALPTDGSADGTYNVSVTPLDKIGRTGKVINRQFTYDTQLPRIISATPIALHQPITYIGGSLTQFQLTVQDVGPASLNLDEQTITLHTSEDETVLGQLTNDGDSQLYFTLSTPLPTDGSADGEYTLTVTLVDNAGNSDKTAHNVFYDSQAPTLSTVTLNTETPLNLTPYETTELTESVSKLTLKFIETTQVDFENTNVTLSGPGGSSVPLTLTDNGVDELTASFVALTQGGQYTLSVTPQDIAGNVEQGAVQYPFRLDLTIPEITSVKANTSKNTIALSPYEIVEIAESVNSFVLEFTDVMRIDIEETNIELSGPNGEQIAATLEEGEGSQLVVRFVSLMQSGNYRFSITPQDTVGNVAQNSTQYQFRLKLQVPQVTSVNAIVTDVPIPLTPYEIIIISNSFSSFILEINDATNLDFENTIITLTGPNGQEIFTTREAGEDSKYFVRFVELTDSGRYTISVTPQDKAGNVAQSATQFQFRLDIVGPSVQSVSIDGKLGSTVYVSNSSPRIIASFTDSLGVGLSFGENGTNIEVTDSEELKVPGTTTTNDSNQLIWTPIPFATDGSADGQYSVAITPVDMNGRSGTVVNRKFIYDSQAPRITAAAPITLHAPVSYIGSGLTEFVLTIQDEGPAGFVLSSQVAALMDASNRPVPATITHNELTNQLYLTLTTPFANDGSADGTYTLNVALTDKAGNRKNSQFAVVYDSRVPQISSVKTNTVGVAKELIANEVTELSESISTITLSFSEATRVDFTNTVVSLTDPSDLSVPLSIEDNGVSEMTISFPNLTEIGQYTLSVTPQDIAGNTASSPIEFTFNLEFILPTVESILIGDTVTLSSGDIAYVNADNLLIVANLLDPADTGLSFDRLTGSSILVTTLDGTTVFGSLSTNNVDVIAWEPITLSTDGSSDGRYAVYVSPVDKQGRQGSTIYREFILDTQEPEITSASPINLSQPVSYVSESLTQIQFTVQDVGPADLVLEDQQVSLRNQSGAIIPTKLTNDSQNQIYLTLDEPLPLDGSRDGEYTVVVEFADKAGNMLSLEHPIIYDTQAPTLVSTVPADGELLTEDLTQIVVNLNDEGDSGIDWELTTVTLVDPNGAEISGEVTSNGKTQLTLNTNQLVSDGRYIIRVQAIDRAGNGNRSIFESSFLLSRRLPAVISTTPLTAPEDEAYTNETVEEIEVLLETVDERHLSTVRLLNADGQVIAGQQQRQADRLIYQLVRPLATDGSDDGLYTIEFTPISASGRTGEVQNLVFTYDTQAPELIPDDIQLIVTEPEVNNSLVEIRVLLTDEQAGIDWENLDEEWFTFEQLTPDSTDIAGRLSYDAEQNILIFRLTVPLADNGSADGEYRITITPIDKADNGDETYEKDFTYDTSPPVIDPATLLLNDAPLLTDRDAVDYPSAISTTGGVVVQASITDVGLGVNLSQSSITIRNPNGQEISGTSQQNGIDTIVFKSDGLNVEGIYQVTITGIGNDSELLGFSPKDSITAAFLYETTEPTGNVINDGGKTEFTDEAIPFEGTAADPQGTRRAGGQQGENEVPVPASGVLLVEIVGTGPDGQEIEPVPAEDDSNAQAQPWSTWSVDFLPTRSGEYDLDLRVTDKAGNYTVYDIGEYTMSVSFSFKGKTFGWPNPLRKSKDGVAFFSFDLNAPEDEAIDMTLYIYDWGGDLVYKQKYANITTGKRDDTRIKWNLENQAGNAVARGIYVFRLEAVNGAGNRANAVGKVLVVD